MATTYTWFGGSGTGNDANNWTPTGGPPGPGDSAIVNSGTVLLQDAQLTGNSLYVESATLVFTGDSSINTSAPTLDDQSTLTTNVAAAETPPVSAQTTVLDAFGNFINDGSIQADGPAGSSFTINVASTTIGGTLYPGFFVNYDLIEVDAGNTMTIAIAGMSELANTGEILVNGGSLFINAASAAIAGGYAPFSGAAVISGGGTIETNVAYATTVAGSAPSYVFSDSSNGNLLKIDTIGSFGGQILGFGQGDTIDIGTSIAVARLAYFSTTGLLELENSGGTILASLFLNSGNFQTGTSTVTGSIGVGSTATAGSFGLSLGSDGDIQITTSVKNDYWSNVSATWQTGGDWSNGVPGTLDSAFVGIGGASAFTLTTGSSPVSVGALTVASNASTLHITSNTTVAPYSVNQFGGVIEITSGNTLTTTALRQFSGLTTLDPTSVLNLTGHLGGGVAASNGVITISNTNTFAARVNGTVLVNGGTINAAPTVGVGGGGNIFIGLDGGGTPGSMTVQNSGTNAGVVTDSYTELSSDPVSFGVLTLNGNVSWTDTIDNKDSSTSTGKMIVGINNVAANTGTIAPIPFTSAATLLVENGASLTDQNTASIAATADSSGVVTVESNGIWTVGTGGLAVGQFGQGILSVLSAGTVSVGSSGISTGGSAQSANGTILVSGASSVLTTSGGITDGKLGQGLMQILNGGTVSLTGTSGFNVGLSANSSGTITVSGTDSGSGASALLSMGTTAAGITVGGAGSGVLAIGSGGTFLMNGTKGIAVGQSLGGLGLLTVTGPNALLNEGTASSGLNLGQGGTGVSGTLEVLSGGAVTIGAKGINVGNAAGAAGTVVVSGTGSSITTLGTAGALSVGSPGTGVATISNGGRVTLSSGLSIANSSTSSSGTVTVDAGTVAANGLTIGNSGTGTLTVQNGGIVTNTGTSNVNIGGNTAGALGIVVVNAGTVIGATSAVFVGNTNASGTLLVENGGQFTTGGGTVFSDINATGTGSAAVSVNGGTWTSGGQILIGDTGNGALSVTGNGLVNAGTNTVSIGAQNGGAGNVTVTAATLIAGSLNIDTGLTTSSTGTLTVGVGGIVQTGLLTEGAGGAITVNGSFSASSNLAIGSTGTNALLTVGSGGVVTQTGASPLQIGGGTLTSGAIVVNTGGSLSSTGINVGGPSGGGGTLAVNGGLVTNTGFLNIGVAGSGSLIVTGGSLVANAGTGVSALSIAGTGGALLSIGSASVSATNGSFSIGGTNASGTLIVGAGGSLTTTGGIGFAASIDAAGTAQASGTVSGVGATWTVNGQLIVGNANSGTLAVGAGGLVNAGTNNINIGNGSTSQGTATVGGSGAQLDGGVLTIGNGSGGVGTLTVSTGGTVIMSGGTFGTVALGGLSVQSTGLLALAGGTLSAAGFSQNNAIVTGFGVLGASFSNSGSVIATGGLLDITGSLTGTGVATIASTGTLELDGLVTPGQIVNFATNVGVLQLGTINFGGTINGIAQGDSIILASVTNATAANILANNTLQILRSSSPEIDLQLNPLQSFTGDYFHLTPSGSNTVITENTSPCYLAGTRIRTAKGEVLVENLSIGDRVMTLDGTAKQIKWIGKRSFSSAFAAGNNDVIPIRIKPGALGRNVPQRDLYVSPLHALFLDDVLIQAEHLVNGETIVRCPHIDPIRYFHIELEQHDIIFAEGAPAETFVDCDSRGMFHNAAEFAQRYPADDSPRWMFCAPRIASGPVLENVRRGIDARAGLISPSGAATGPLQGNLDGVDGTSITGWAFDPTHPERSTTLEVLDGDGLIARVTANRFRADLEAAGVGDGRHGFELRLTRALSPSVRHELRVRRVPDGRELPGSPLVIEPHDGKALLREAGHAIAVATETADPTTLDALLDTLLHSVDTVRRLRAPHPTDADRHDRLLGWEKTRRQQAKRALIIDEVLPRRDGASAILGHIAALRALGWQVEFVAARELSRGDDAAGALRAWGVTCHRAPLVASVEEVLRRNRGQFELVYLRGLSNAESYTPMVRAWQHRAYLVYGETDLAEGGQTRQRAIQAMRLMDAVIIHSETEAAELARSAPGANLHVVPWALHAAARGVKLRKRHGLAFLGSERHAPNPDAMRWLAEEIMPAVWERDPDMRCLIVGSGWDGPAWSRLDRRIERRGAVDRLDAVFDQVRLTVAPWRLAAGINGTVLASLAAGVPSVMSPSAAAGLPLCRVLRSAVTDDASEMAELICDLHHQPVPHGRLARAGLALVREHYTEALVTAAMQRVVGFGLAAPVVVEAAGSAGAPGHRRSLR